MQYYRGHRILDAVLDSMLAAGLTKAKTLIVNGCSAGGLSVYLHIDYIRSRVPESVRVVGVPECGLFMDETAWDSGPGFTPSCESPWICHHLNLSIYSVCARRMSWALTRCDIDMPWRPDRYDCRQRPERQR